MRPQARSGAQGGGVGRPALLSHTTDRILLLYLLAVLIATGLVLSLHWNEGYTQRLREWLLVNAALATVRTVGRVLMHAFPPDRWHTVRRGLVWMFRVLTVASLAWFIVGIRFLQLENGKEVRNGPVHLLMTVIIAFELVVLGLSIILGVVIFLFALHPVLAARNGVPAATEEDLSKLRVFRFGEDVVAEGGNDTELACSICLCDYQTDDLLRELPCAVGRHVFHAECVDEWLTQKLSCPICRDDPLGRSDGAAATTTATRRGEEEGGEEEVPV